MSANSVVRIEALGRENYDTWKLQMRALLVKNDAWVFVSGKTMKPEPTEANAAEVHDWNKRREGQIGPNSIDRSESIKVGKELRDVTLPSSFKNFGIAIESRDEFPNPEILRTKIIEESDARRNAATLNQPQNAMFVNKKKCYKQKEYSVNKEDPKKKNVQIQVDTCQMADSADQNVWCLNSGCTSHICKDVKLFTEISQNESSKLNLTSDAPVEIKARGVATIATINGQEQRDLERNITRTEIRTNLLSVTKITDKGYKVVFDKHKAAVTDRKGHTKLTVKRAGNLYFVNGESSDRCQNVENDKEDDTTIVPEKVETKDYETGTHPHRYMWSYACFVKWWIEEFKVYQVFVEKQYNAKIKAIQSDNGREYVNKEFDEYLKGIQRRFTTAYTPEQNGIAERKNRTLVDSARYLLLQFGLPPLFWAEAVHTVNYMKNCCPTKKPEKRTPHEFWKGQTPAVNYLRSFGCKVFCLNRALTRGKFDAKSREGIFIGYTEQSKGFRIWLPKSRKVEITRDVRFLENDLGTSDKSSESFYPEDAVQDRSIDQKVIDGDIDIEMISEPINITPEDPDEEVGDKPGGADAQEETAPVRRRGRPRIIRTGLPGRPRKDYSQRETDQTDLACAAEIKYEFFRVGKCYGVGSDIFNQKQYVETGGTFQKSSCDRKPIRSTKQV
ncbi:uncharacterized protein [Anoplolepis gracilipes]|uniref:uncharacterized protein n=1 Tax=Anoplolepis gracilipes TaxID=354296 RepID=UPI003BA11E9C